MKHIPFSPTDEQRANLMRLAAHLDLGVTNREFDMGTFNDLDAQPDKAHSCGTVACAAGHGPSLGIIVDGCDGWIAYCDKAFGAPIGEPSHDWLFSGSWGIYDNSPRGAAARINYALKQGIPENAREQMDGEAPLSYTFSERPEFTVAQKVTA